MSKSIDLNKWSGILVYLQCFEGEIHPVGKELIGKAAELSVISGEEIYVAGIGRNLELIEKALKGCQVNFAYLYEAPDEYEQELYTSIMIDVINEIKPATVLIGGTDEGRLMASSLAVKFKSGVTADCTMLSLDKDGNLLQTRPAFGGNVMADIITPSSRPQFATVRLGIMEAQEKDYEKNPVFIKRDAKVKKGKIEIIKREKILEEDNVLNKDIIVAVGRGIKKKEDLAMMEEFADIIGAGLMCSRAIVEKGFMNQKRQIGLSGNTVNPRYIITCGISGTVQFMAGMKQVKNIIAINNDKDARIFQIAHYSICADLYEVIPAFLDKVKKER